MITPGRPAGDVEAALGIDAKRRQKLINSTDAQFGEIGQGGSQVRRADGRQAEDSSGPAGSIQQPPRVEPAHAVADHMHSLVGKRALDLFAQDSGPGFHSRDRGDASHEHAVARRLQGIRDSPEVRRQGESPQADLGESKEPVRQHDRRGQPGDSGRKRLQSRHGARLGGSSALLPRARAARGAFEDRPSTWPAIGPHFIVQDRRPILNWSTAQGAVEETGREGQRGGAVARSRPGSGDQLARDGHVRVDHVVVIGFDPRAGRLFRLTTTRVETTPSIAIRAPIHAGVGFASNLLSLSCFACPLPFVVARASCQGIPFWR